MACFHPITAYRTTDGAVFFDEKKRHGDFCEVLQVPCGRCEGCLSERARQWSVRIVHEASRYDASSFVTLTYDDDHLPAGGNLVYSDFQAFVKRLRRRVGKVRYFVAGEYGERSERPHFHACLFGVDFPDKVPIRWRDSRPWLFTSDVLDSAWGQGFASVGEVTAASARYCAQYVMKKFGSPVPEGRVPEFSRCSLRPGIGADWIKEFMSDVYPHDYVVVDGVKSKPPRYYDKKFKERDVVTLENDVMYSRVVKARRRFADSSDERLAARERVAKARREFFTKKIL